jgi:hypothetical protein
MPSHTKEIEIFLFLISALKQLQWIKGQNLIFLVIPVGFTGSPNFVVIWWGWVGSYAFVWSLVME